MLEDNAGFLRLYTEAYQVFGYESYRTTADDLINFLLDYMYNKEKHFFYGSIDADEKYYLCNLEERKKLLFPSIDRTLYTNWNAEAVYSMLYAGTILNNERAVEAGFNVLNTIIAGCMDEDGVIYHSWDKNLGMLLTDIYSVTKTMVNVYFLTGDRKYLNIISRILDKAMKCLWDEENPGFLDRQNRENEMGELRRKQKPFILNSKMAELLVIYSCITGEEKWRRRADEILDLFAGVYKDYSIFGAVYAEAFYFTKSPTLQLSVIGDSSEETKKLLYEAYRFYYPGKSIVFYDINIDRDRIKQKGFHSDVTPVIFPCEGTQCFPPVKNVQELAGLTEKLK
jgi:uncharacterized protein YyaL (SSP411 family)